MNTHWRADAIKDGFVYRECHEPVKRSERAEFIRNGHLCSECYNQIQGIKFRFEIEREDKPICE